MEFSLYDNGFKIKDLTNGTFIIETASPTGNLPIGFASYPNSTVDYVDNRYSVVKDGTPAFEWWTNSVLTWTSNDPLYTINSSFKNSSTGELMNLHVELPGSNKVKVEIKKAISVSEPWKYRTRLRLKLFPDEYFLGFGTRLEGVAFRNKKMLNWISEVRIKNSPSFKPENQGEARVPFYISTRGYGMLLNENTCSEFDLGETDPNIHQINVWEQHLNFTVYLGSNPREIIKNYTEDAGRILRMPEPWVFGVWMMTKNRSNSQTESDRSAYVADLLRRDSIPCSALWHHYWSKKILNVLGNQKSWEVDPDYWPNYGSLINSHREEGFKVLHYYWPYIFNNDAEFSYADKQGYFMKNWLNTTYLNPWFLWFNQVAEPDLTRQTVRNWYKNTLMKNALNAGSSGWMADFGEHHRIDMVDSAKGNPYAVHNEFPLHWAKTNQEFWEQNQPNGDYVYFMRGGWTGMQKYSPVMINDPAFEWSKVNGIKSQIPTALSGGISGHPLVVPHVAGYAYAPPVILPTNIEEL
ncbi:MAG TPA: TIM-barrel domain-containing protein, partial [Cytophagaceae bacterium]